MPDETCRLCGAAGPLQLSHIIPAFVFRWQRSTAGGGYLRYGLKPNQRVQDGMQRYLLCPHCEGRLNQAETKFATRLFHPYSNRERYRFKYGPWLLQFGVSVVWRVLQFYKEEGHLEAYYPADQLRHAAEAEMTWREFLRGNLRNPGRFEVHMLPQDEIVSASTQDLPPNINRYLLRAIDTDVTHSQSTSFVYAKLGRFMFLGFTFLKHPKQWVGTKVHATEGIIEPRKYVIPGQLLEYIKHKATRVSVILEALSPRQQEKVQQSIRQNADKIANSDLMQAMNADVRIFGNAAFAKDRAKK